MIPQIPFPQTDRLNALLSRCKNILPYKFTDLIGSGKVNSKRNTEAETSLTAGKYTENSVVLGESKLNIR
jgi:hypothetical protein